MCLSEGGAQKDSQKNEMHAYTPTGERCTDKIAQLKRLKVVHKEEVQFTCA